MKIVIIGKFPPIQGGVSLQTYLTSHELARRNHEVHVVTNSTEVEHGYKEFFLGDDMKKINCLYQNVHISVHSTQSISDNKYIPWANPYASKLFGLGINVIEENGCDIIVGWYFEPYGLVAAQIGEYSKKPVIIIHAGSDLYRLAKHSDLSISYKWMLSRAYKIMSPHSKETRLMLNQLEVDEEKLISYGINRIPFVSGRIDPNSKLESIRRKSLAWIKGHQFEDKLKLRLIDLNSKSIDYNVPVISIYGKVGKQKGSYELLEALEKLSKEFKFNFITISGGSVNVLREYYSSLLEREKLKEQTWIFPLIAPWRIQEFLKQSYVACYLEHDFDVPHHGSVIPREILASGSCLICSSEVISNLPFKENLVDKKNVIIVKDLGNSNSLFDCLAYVLQDRNKGYLIGKNGQLLSKYYEQQFSKLDTVANKIEEHAKKTKQH